MKGRREQKSNNSWMDVFFLGGYTGAEVELYEGAGVKFSRNETTAEVPFASF